MYHVNCLRKMHIDPTLICLFYNSIVMSVLSYAITSWFNGCSESLKRDLNKFRKRVCKMVPREFQSNVQSTREIFSKNCVAICEKILDDEIHPLHQYFKRLPHHNNMLSMIYCRTNRFKDTFVPSAVTEYDKFAKKM